MGDSGSDDAGGRWQERDASLPDGSAPRLRPRTRSAALANLMRRRIRSTRGWGRQGPAGATPQWLFCYGMGLLSAAVGVALTFLLESRLEQTPTPLLFAAVTLAAWYGGLGPGLLATAVCAAGLNILLRDDTGDAAAGGTSLLHLGVFALVAVLVSTLNERRRRAEQRARSDSDRLKVLAAASRAFSAAVPDQTKTLQTVAERVAQAIGDACVISLLSEDRQWLVQTAWHHTDPTAHALMAELYAGVRHGADEGISGHVVQTGRPVFLAEFKSLEASTIVKPEYAPFLERFPITSLLSVPLRARGPIIGTLTIVRNAPDRPYTPADQQLLQELADRAALAIDNARLAAYHRVLFESIPEAVVVADSVLTFVDANPAAVRLLGCSRDDLRGRRLTDVLDDDGRSTATEEVPGLSRGGWHGEIGVRRDDGRTIPVEATMVPIELPTGTVVVGTWHDLSEQRALQAMREEFVASAAHELRTPLTATFAALRLLEHTGIEALQPEQQELMANAQRNVQRLRFLTDDFLAQSQLQANALHLELKPLDLRSVVADAVEAVHLLNRRKDQMVEIDAPESLPVAGDAQRLGQVLVNLLANASVHTPSGTRVSIAGRVVDGEVCLTVQDEGPGLRTEELEQIFQRFSRGESAGGGTGLGLAIARDLVAAHGGRIWAESAPGRGAAFHLVLPLAGQGAS